MQNNNYLKCYAPWHSLVVRFNGDITPDGVYWNRYGNIFEKSFEEVVNSDIAKNTRKSLLKNIIPAECNTCTMKEQVTGHSRRMFFKDILNPLIDKDQKYTEEFKDVRFLEFNMSNICNLKCRMCNGISSSAWIKDEHKLFNLNADYDRPVNHPEFGYKSVDTTIIENLFENENYFQNLNYLSIKGGEPYMEPGNKIILQKLIDMGIAEKITLDLTTNGTIVDEELHNLALQFGHTKWTVSLEGTGDLYKYIRGGKNFNFKELERNLQKYYCFDRVIIAVTIMTYNICHLQDIKDWYMDTRDLNWEIYFNNVVTTPHYLNPSILPQKILDKANANNDIPGINYVHNLNLATYFKTFIDYTKDLDKIRQENLLSVCPEFEEYYV